MSNFASNLFTRLHDMVSGPGGSMVSNVMDLVHSPPDSSMSSVPVVSNAEDRRLLEKTYKHMESVLRSCQQPKLNLKSSPPFLLDILPAICQLLNQIFLVDPDVLQTNEYLRIFVGNLLAKSREVGRLFRNSDIFVEDSSSRSELSVYSLVFSHMLFELKAEFPDKKFISSRFRITKKDAAEFWNSRFGDRAIVPWDEFRTELGKVHTLQIGVQTSALLQTIDLSKNNYISNFEFDVFTRLFHPWTTIVQNWECLAVTHPAYMSFITYEEVKRKLQRFTKKPGAYVFRLSCTRLGQWAIGYVGKDHKIYQTIPQNKSLVQSLVEGHRDGFYLFPMGKDRNVDLSYMMSTSVTQDRMKVSPEQYQIYCEMGTTFELCKICDERDKDVKLEPCGHLLCRACLVTWQQSEGDKSCPFCRCEIKGCEKILIETFRPARNALEPNDSPNSTPNSSRVSWNDSERAEASVNGHAPPIPPKRVLPKMVAQISPPKEQAPPTPPSTTTIPSIPPRKNAPESAVILNNILSELATLDLSASPTAPSSKA